MRTLFSCVKINKKYLAGLLVLMMIGTVAEMMLPTLLATMIDKGIAEESRSYIITIAIIMAVMAVITCVANIVTTALSAKISTGFAAGLRKEIFHKVQDLSAADMDRFGTASLVARSTSDVTNVQSFLTLLLRMGVMAPLMAIAGMVLSAATGGKVSSVLNVAIPVLLISAAVIILAAARYSVSMRKKMDRMNSLFLETLEGVRVIRAFNRQQTEMDRFRDENQEYTKVMMKSGRLTGALMPVIQVIFGVTTAAVMGLGSYYVGIGEMEVGALVANSQYISMILMSVILLAAVIMMFPNAYACAGRIREVLETENSTRLPILVDGVDVRKWRLSDLRRRIGYVPQKNVLFTGDIASNLNFGDESGQEEDWKRAAEIACADEFIEKKTDRYHEHIAQGGTNLSGGQRQRLAIARAMACDPEIMILDEATSNVDTYTEQKIQDAMAKLMKGRTSFVIAHRLSTIRDADMILYMENGDIKEAGNHDELMARHGKYEQLYLSQFAS